MCAEDIPKKKKVIMSVKLETFGVTRVEIIIEEGEAEVAAGAEIRKTNHQKRKSRLRRRKIRSINLILA